MPSKYASIRDQIHEMVLSLDVGEAIPPERALCRRFGVSRMTLRRALDDLVREGFLERFQGRGTFVAAPKIAQRLTMTSFSEEMRRRGLAPSSKTLSFSRMKAGAPLGPRLQVSPDTDVLRFSRLRLADAKPMAIETLYVPAARVPGLTAPDLTDRSFYELLEDRYGLEVVAGYQTIEPTVTNEEESELLTVPLHSPAFLFERTSRTQDDAVVEFVRSVYRGDRYQLAVELRRSWVRPPGAGREDEPADMGRPLR